MSDRKWAASEGAYLAWVESVHLPIPGEADLGFAVLDLLHPSEVSLIRSRKLNFRSLVERPVEDGLKTLPLILPFKQMKAKWVRAILQAETERRKLYVWVSDDPARTQEGNLGRAVLALTGWDQDDGAPDQSVFIDNIEVANLAESLEVDAALRSASYLSSLPSPTSHSGKKKVTKERFLRDILEHPTRSVSQISVGVYDVGQGSASALVDGNEHPRVFFDVGKPISIFNHTRPANRPNFFHCDATKTLLGHAWCHAPVLLSHWDFDHWAGVLKSAYVHVINGKKVAKLTLIPHALDRYWIVPNQEHLDLSPTHVELIRLLAKSVNTGTGLTALQYWPETLSQVRFTHGVVVKAIPDALSESTIAAKRNNSGLVMLLTIPHGARASKRPWVLLPGDARSESIPIDLKTLNLVGTVISHHGGVLGAVPSAASWLGYLTPNPNIVCSVGGVNIHGAKPYGHPNPKALTAHTYKNWDPVTFTFNHLTPAGSTKRLGNYCVSLDSFQPKCGCSCVEASNLSLNRIPGT